MDKNLARLLGSFLVAAFLNAAKANGAPVIDMVALAQIESSGNPKAFNKKTKATGLFQITPICLKDFNKQNKKRYTLKQMFDEDKCREVADWYAGVRIPQMLQGIGVPITTQRILWAWNAGIWAVIHDKMPKETAEFIIRYNKLAKEV